MCSSQQKEVVDSRVESRVGNLIACYSFDFSQINVIFVFFFFFIYLQTCINYVKIIKNKILSNMIF